MNTNSKKLLVIGDSILSGFLTDHRIGEPVGFFQLLKIMKCFLLAKSRGPSALSPLENKLNNPIDGSYEINILKILQSHFPLDEVSREVSIGATFRSALRAPGLNEKIRDSSVILIQLGGNDLFQFHEKPDFIARSMELLLARIKEQNPSAFVVIWSNSRVSEYLAGIDLEKKATANRLLSRLRIRHMFRFFGIIDVVSYKKSIPCYVRAEKRINEVYERFISSHKKAIIFDGYPPYSYFYGSCSIDGLHPSRKSIEDNAPNFKALIDKKMAEFKMKESRRLGGSQEEQTAGQ